MFLLLIPLPTFLSYLTSFKSWTNFFDFDLIFKPLFSSLYPYFYPFSLFPFLCVLLALLPLSLSFLFWYLLVATFPFLFLICVSLSVCHSPSVWKWALHAVMCPFLSLWNGLYMHDICSVLTCLSLDFSLIPHNPSSVLLLKPLSSHTI